MCTIARNLNLCWATFHGVCGGRKLQLNMNVSLTYLNDGNGYNGQLIKLSKDVDQLINILKVNYSIYLFIYFLSSFSFFNFCFLFL